MIVLHIGSVSEDLCNGVNIAVEQHIKAQSKFAKIGFVNIKNVFIEGFENQFMYDTDFTLEELPEPFSNPDLVVFHEVYRVQYLSISRKIIERKIPYIILPHGELSKGSQSKKVIKKKLANLFVFNSFINNATAIQCLSDQEKNTTLFKPHKFVGTNGVIMPKIKKEMFNDSGIKLLYIGRLDVDIKGLDLMIKAVSELSDVLLEANAKLYIYGPDIKGRFSEVESLIQKHGVANIISLNHEIIKEDKEKELLSADIFIQTSRTEGMPLGILEALSYGVPCIITEGTALTKVVTEYDAGWSCKTNVVGIKDGIISAINSKESFRNKSKMSRLLVAQEFSWDRIARDTIDQYMKFVGI